MAALEGRSLYKWQEDCLNAWKGNNCQGTVNVVTGAGKTFLACAAIEYLQRRHKGLRVRIVVPTIPLAEQWQKALLSWFGESLREEPGFYYGAVKDDVDLSCLIYVVNTARHALSWHIRKDLNASHPVFLICDECHRYTSRENRRIFDFVTPKILAGGSYFSLGLSATPFAAEDPGIILDSLGPEIFCYHVMDAVREKTLSPFTICTVAASFLPEEAMQYAEITDAIAASYARMISEYPFLKDLGDKARRKAVQKLAKEADMDPSDPAAAYVLLLYRRKEISLLARARIQCAEDLILSFRDRRRILIFSERIEQARDLYIRLSERFPHRCGIYHSQMSPQARKNTLKEFRQDHIHILVTCKCLDEGLDVPDADVGIVMSSSAVERQRIQRLGRIIRKKKEDRYALLYYLYIYNSHDDSAYLPGLDMIPTFFLRYYSLDHLFSNPIYEEASLSLINRVRDTSSDETVKELQACILEGMTLPDFLLEEKALDRQIRKADDRHEKNYFLTQKRLGQLVLNICKGGETNPNLPGCVLPERSPDFQPEKND
jgi:superfamily II DNA or RNA helicase